MAGQEQRHTLRPGGAEGDGPDLTGGAGAGQAQRTVAAVDELLDDIDDVLESNAETFVRGFVQKGGQ